jgi:hypothetical protein
MKKLFFGLACLTLVTVSSCKKCGYCDLPGGQVNGSAYCKGTQPFSGNDYREAQANCQADGGTWVLTK